MDIYELLQNIQSTILYDNLISIYEIQIDYYKKCLIEDYYLINKKNFYNKCIVECELKILELRKKIELIMLESEKYLNKK